MKKRVFYLAILTILLTSCSNPNIPKDILNFVNNISFKETLEQISNGSFSQTYVEKIGDEVVGENTIDFTFWKDLDDFGFTAIYNFSGNQIVDQISKKTISLKATNQPNSYIFETEEKEKKTEYIDYEKAWGMFYKIFDSGTNSYRVGGLYYGDFFAINLNKFYRYYSISEDKSVLRVTEENAQYLDNMKLDQVIYVDKKGMLLKKTENAYSNDKLNIGSLVQTASYTYINA